MAQDQPTAEDIGNVERPVHWRDRATGRGYLKLGGIGISVFFLSAVAIERSTGQVMVLAVAGLGCLLLVIWGLIELLSPKAPYLMLSPEGLVLQPDSSMVFIVPWPEMTGVEMTDFKASVPGNSSELLPSLRYRMSRGVTALTIPKAFYDAHIHVEGRLKRGPGWENVFADAGESVRIILHPEMMRADPRELFRAVDVRWRAFGGR
jgi:hypothetical protein